MGQIKLFVQTRAAAHDVAPRVRTPRCRSVQRSFLCAGVLLCMTSMATGRVPSREATLAGAPPAARHWPLGQPHVAKHCRPHRACSDRRGDPTTLQLTSHDYIDKSPTAPLAHTIAARAPAATTGQSSPSSPIRRFSKPGDPPTTFHRTHRSYPGHPLFSPAPILTGIRASAAAPPLLRRRRSPVTSLVDPPLPIERG
jgi:hypothetical protein